MTLSHYAGKPCISDRMTIITLKHNTEYILNRKTSAKEILPTIINLVFLTTYRMSPVCPDIFQQSLFQMGPSSSVYMGRVDTEFPHFNDKS